MPDVPKGYVDAIGLWQIMCYKMGVELFKSNETGAYNPDEKVEG